jgi:shikimate kinase
LSEREGPQRERTSTPAVVLVGPPGSGKTSVGQVLAERLGVSFRDTDADVEAVAGKPVPEIFYDDGEAVFRDLERQAVAAALAGHDGVLALGGGAVLAAETRQLLAGHPVVFLDVDPAEAARRVGLARDRPLLAVNPRARLRVLMAERRPLYEEVAAATVPTGGRSVAEVADAVLAVPALAPPRGRLEARTRDAARKGGPGPRS